MNDQSQPVSTNSTSQDPKASQGGSRVVLPILLVLVFAIFGVVYWVMVTESGQKAWESLGSGSKIAAEKGAAEKLQSAGVLVIAEPPDQRITSVSFTGVPVSDELLEDVSKLYRVLTVNLSDTKITDGQIHYIASLPHITTLLLTDAPLTDAGVKQLTTLNVKNLYLAGTQITDAALNDLAKLSSLQLLDLSRTKVTDNGMQRLVPLNKLEWLILTDTSITDSGLDDLANIKSLHRLSIKNAKVTGDGVKRLKQAIPGLTVDQ